MAVINLTDQVVQTPSGCYEVEFTGCKGLLQIQHGEDPRDYSELFLKFPDMLPNHEAYIYGRNALHALNYPTGVTLILRSPVRPIAVALGIYDSNAGQIGELANQIAEQIAINSEQQQQIEEQIRINNEQQQQIDADDWVVLS